MKNPDTHGRIKSRLGENSEKSYAKQQPRNCNNVDESGKNSDRFKKIVKILS